MISITLNRTRERNKFDTCNTNVLHIDIIYLFSIAMAKTDYINTRIDPDVKRGGEAILSRIGLKPSEAITMFYRQIIMHKGLPFDARIPNEETIAALNEPRENMKRYESFEEYEKEILTLADENT